MARRGTGLGFASVIAYDPYASEVKAAALGVKLVSWEEALAQGDFFSLHMPQTPQTKVCIAQTPAAHSLCLAPRAAALRSMLISCEVDTGLLILSGGAPPGWVAA